MHNKTVIQTSILKPEGKHIEELMSHAQGWDYVHFDDAEIIKFFSDNPIEGFENIVDKFYQIRHGQHRADLFRYYYMYLNGGFFLDLDLTVIRNLNDIVNGYDFVSALIKTHDPSVERGTKRARVFNGYMYATKAHPVIHQALMHLYHLDPDDLGLDASCVDWSRYHVVCEQLYHIIVSQPDKSKIKLFRITDDPGISVLLDGDEVIGRHK